MLACAGELGIFEMRSTGLEAVTNAAALFVPSATVGHQTGSSDGSNRLVGTAIAVIQDGARPLPIEVQALVAPRLRVVAQEPAQFVDDGYGGSYSDVTDGASDSEGDVSDLAFGEGDDSYEDESSFGSDITGAGLMRGADKFVAAEAGVSPREVLPMVRSIVGLPDRARMGQLLELLTRYTPIKVCWGREGLKFGGPGVQGCLCVGNWARLASPFVNEAVGCESHVRSDSSSDPTWGSLMCRTAPGCASMVVVGHAAHVLAKPSSCSGFLRRTCLPGFFGVYPAAAAAAVVWRCCVQAHQYNIYVNVVAGVTLPKGETLAGAP